jgi:hypothetical protein
VGALVGNLVNLVGETTHNTAGTMPHNSNIVLIVIDGISIITNLLLHREF